MADILGTEASEDLLGTDAADRITGSGGGDRLYGKGGNDQLHGGTGNDFLDGGAGPDAMFGGSGDDIYRVDDAADVVSEETVAAVDDGGIDTAQSSITFALGRFLENLTLTGTAAIDGTGNDLANRITGNGAANTLSGGGGNDTLVGGAGHDRLIGGANKDTLTGGTGSDTFVLGAADAASTDNVTDFTAEDWVGIVAGDYGLRAGSGLVDNGAGILRLHSSYFAPVSGSTNIQGTVFGHGQFVYNTTTRALMWDADGAGAGSSGIALATFNSGAVLSAEDFAVTVAAPVVGNISINDVTITEGNAGTTTATFTVSRTGTAGFAVDFTTADGTATAGADYATKAVTLTFTAGQATQTVAVTINGDTTVEGSETFFANLTNATNGGTILDGQGLGTITNDDAAPVVGDIAIGDVTITEGDAGTKTATFTVSRTGAAAFSVDFATAAGTATAGVDYAANSGTLTFAAGQATQTVAVTINGDTVFEGGETYFVNLTNATSGAIVEPQGLGTITNDDAAPPLPTDINGTDADQDLIGTTADERIYGFGGKDRLYGKSGNDQLYGGAGNDFLDGGAHTDTIYGGSGDDTYRVDDPTDVASEEEIGVGVDDGGSDTVQSSITFTLGRFLENLTLTSAAAIDGTGNDLANRITGNGAANILTGGRGSDTLIGGAGDDWLIGGADKDTLTGGTGSDTFVFAADAASTDQVTDFTAEDRLGIVAGNYGLRAGSGLGNDGTGTLFLDSAYFATVSGSTNVQGTASGHGQFVFNTTTRTLMWDADGAGTNSSGLALATFNSGVVLSAATFAITTAPVVGNISINDVTIAEGNGGTKTATFTVSRTGTAALAVDFATAAGTATANDYAARSGTLSFAAGQATQTVSVTINGDTTTEPDETFFVNLSNATGGSIVDAQGRGTITNDDAAPVVVGDIAINDVTITEGNGGATTATFTVSRTGTAAFAVDFATAAGTATAGIDYLATSGTLSLAAGEAAQAVAVTINGDTAFEGNETFFVNLANATNGGTILDGRGLGTISNDDAAPVVGNISINDVTIMEGNSGTTTATFTVSRTGTAAFAVDFATAAGTATAGVDYAATSGTLSFAAGQAAQTVAVTINGDTAFEGTETFFVNLTNATNGGAIVDGQTLGTITNDDPAPGNISINDVAIEEGNSGTTTATFTVSRTGTAAFAVDFATGAGTATAGGDYLATSGTLSFAAGQAARTVAVTINGDTAVEGNETFFVNLTNATNGGTIDDGMGLGTIGHAPIGIALSANGVTENVAGAIVGTLSASDPDPGDTHTFSISDARFEVVGSQLKLKDGVRLDYEAAPRLDFAVTAIDEGGLAVTRTLTVAVGDVAEVRFAAFGDYGFAAGSQRVANLVASLNVDFIVTTGDNVYTSASIDDQIGRYYSDYIGNYTGAYGTGSAINRFFPALGDNEPTHPLGGMDAYLNYFALPGNERYYDFQMGPIHFFAINSDSSEPDGRSSTSVQGQWLQSALQASDSAYNIVISHHPPYSSGTTGSSTAMRWPFEAWGATAVLTSHAHVYERILRDDNGDGEALPYFISGLGGHSRSGFTSTPTAGSAARYNTDFGTMLVQASDATITFEFYSVTGEGTRIDSTTIDLPGANLLTAGGNDTLTGGAGADFMNGLSGDDLLTGLGGNDTLIGGDGDDTFALGSGFGHDVIRDFTAGAGSPDVIRFSTAVFANFAAVQAAMSQAGADVVIRRDAADTVTLSNVDLGQLHQDDFWFV